MESHVHLSVNSFLACLMRFLFQVNLAFMAIFIIWSVLIDVDHLILFAIKYKAFTIRKWIKIGYATRSKMQAHLYVFHSPEVNIALFFLCFLHPLFLPFFLCGLTHVAMDIIDHYKYHRNFAFIKKWSIFYALKHKKSRS